MPPKRKKSNPLDSLDSEQGPSGFGFDASGQGEILVDFEVCTISEDDFHGICTLLAQAFISSNVDISGLTDIIIKQAEQVGSSIKVCNDDEDSDNSDVENDVASPSDDCVFGVTSLIHMSYFKDRDCIKATRELLLSHCQAYATSMLPRLAHILSDSVGLLINERLLNIPAQIAPPVLTSLLMELKEASLKLPQQFTCKYYILLTRSHTDPQVSSGKREHNENGASINNRDIVLTFDYSECELLQEVALLSFNFPVEDNHESAPDDVQLKIGGYGIKQYRTVLVFEASKFTDAVANLEYENIL